jgi:predicted negative regulator of RcsB-dependent stress response
MIEILLLAGVIIGGAAGALGYAYFEGKDNKSLRENNAQLRSRIATLKDEQATKAASLIERATRAEKIATAYDLAVGKIADSTAHKVCKRRDKKGKKPLYDDLIKIYNTLRPSLEK